MDPKISPAYFSLIGRQYNELNCWQLAREFYRICLGVELKHYFEDPTVPERKEVRDLIYANTGDFEKATLPLQFGDILLFKIRGIESHIGVFIEPGKFLHSQKKVGSCIERLEKWKHLLVCAYRLGSKT